MNSALPNKQNEQQISIELHCTSHVNSNSPSTKTLLQSNSYTSAISDNISLEDTKSTISEENSALKQPTISSSSYDSSYFKQKDSDSLLEISNKISSLDFDEEIIDISQLKNTNKATRDIECYIDCDNIFHDVVQELSVNITNKITEKINNLKMIALNWFNLIKAKYNALNYYKEDVFFINQLVIFLSFLFNDNMNKQQYNKIIEQYYTCFKYSRLYWLHLMGKLLYDINDSKLSKNEYKNNASSIEKIKKVLKYNKIDIYSFSFSYEKLSSALETLNSFIVDSSRKLIMLLRKRNADFKLLLDRIYSNESKSFIDMYNKLESSQVFIIKIKEINKKLNTCINSNANISTNLNKLLPPNQSNEKKYTLVLDLDETLVHYVENDKDNSSYVQIRNGSEEFIRCLSKHFEIVIFTASIQEYADIVIDSLESNEYIDYRLYCQHTTKLNEKTIKDLSKLNRDLTKTIIIDNDKDNFQLQPENGLEIKEYHGDNSDKELIYLLDDILALLKTSLSDIRKYLPYIRIKMKSRHSLK